MLNAPGRRSRTGIAPPGVRAVKRWLPSASVAASAADQSAGPVVATVDGAGGARGQPDTPLVVDADDGVLGPSVEEGGLGREVVLHVAVEVQVVLGEVGEGADREPRARHPAQGERVARHLHRHVGDAGLTHHREERLQVGRLRRGERAGQPGAVDADADGAEQPRGAPGRVQPGLDQVRDRRLAAGAGDPEDREVGGRVAVDESGDGAEHVARVGVDEHRDVAQRRAGGPVGIGEHGGRASREGIGGEIGAVGARAGQGGEQVAGTDLGGPERDPRDQDIACRAGGARRGGDGAQGGRPNLARTRRKSGRGRSGDRSRTRSGHAAEATGGAIVTRTRTADRASVSSAARRAGSTGHRARACPRRGARVSAPTRRRCSIGTCRTRTGCGPSTVRRPRARFRAAGGSRAGSGWSSAGCGRAGRRRWRCRGTAGQRWSRPRARRA